MKHESLRNRADLFHGIRAEKRTEVECVNVPPLRFNSRSILLPYFQGAFFKARKPRLASDSMVGRHVTLEKG